MVVSQLCYPVFLATLCTFPSSARPVQEHAANSTDPTEVEIIALGRQGEQYKMVVSWNNDSLYDNATLEKPFCKPVLLHEDFWYIRPERGRIVYTPEPEDETRIPLYTKAHLECESGFEPTHTDELLSTEVFCTDQEATGARKPRARWMPPGTYLGNCARIGILHEPTTPDGSGSGVTETRSSGTVTTDVSGSGTSLPPCPTTPGQTQPPTTTVYAWWYDSSGTGSGEGGTSTATSGSGSWFYDSSGSGLDGARSTTQAHDSTATTTQSDSETTSYYPGSGYASSTRACTWSVEDSAAGYVVVEYVVPEPVQQPAVQTFEGLSGMLKALPLPINAFAP